MAQPKSPHADFVLLAILAEGSPIKIAATCRKISDNEPRLARGPIFIIFVRTVGDSISPHSAEDLSTTQDPIGGLRSRMANDVIMREIGGNDPRQASRPSNDRSTGPGLLAVRRTMGLVAFAEPASLDAAL